MALGSRMKSKSLCPSCETMLPGPALLSDPRCAGLFAYSDPYADPASEFLSVLVYSLLLILRPLDVS
jgi:hypothetical protein